MGNLYNASIQYSGYLKQFQGKKSKGGRGRERDWQTTGRQIDMMNLPILKQYLWLSLGLEWKIKTISLCRSIARHICRHFSSSCSLNWFLPAAKGVFIYNSLPTLEVQLRHILTWSPGFFNEIDPQVPRFIAFTLTHVVFPHFFFLVTFYSLLRYPVITSQIIYFTCTCPLILVLWCSDLKRHNSISSLFIFQMFIPLILETVVCQLFK